MLPEHLQKYSEPQKILDHGHVRLVDVMGGDEAIVQAARVSYGKGTKTVQEDRGLIRYLLRNAHTSPFEMCEIKLHLKMPIFVARQWIRHRMASLNEYSGRYSEMPDQFYVPTLDRVQAQSTSNKQGSGEQLPLDLAGGICTMMRDQAEIAYAGYQVALGHNVARELARVTLPVSNYTEMYWKMDLHNLLHFLRLRLDSHAQYEIRVFAEKIAEIVKEWVPQVWEAFNDYRLDAISLSGLEVKGLKMLFQYMSSPRHVLLPAALSPEDVELLRASVQEALMSSENAPLEVLAPEDPIEIAIKGSGLKGRERDEFRTKLQRLFETVGE